MRRKRSQKGRYLITKSNHNHHEWEKYRETRHKKELCNTDELPFHCSMVSASKRGFSSYSNYPLQNWLKRQVGRLYEDIYHDYCERIPKHFRYIKRDRLLSYLIDFPVLINHELYILSSSGYIKYEKSGYRESYYIDPITQRLCKLAKGFNIKDYLWHQDNVLRVKMPKICQRNRKYLRYDIGSHDSVKHCNVEVIRILPLEYGFVKKNIISLCESCREEYRRVFKFELDRWNFHNADDSNYFISIVKDYFHNRDLSHKLWLAKYKIDYIRKLYRIINSSVGEAKQQILENKQHVLHVKEQFEHE